MDGIEFLSKTERMNIVSRVDSASKQSGSGQTQNPSGQKIPWKGKWLSQNIIQVDDKFPRFNLNNKRTRDMQPRYIKENNLPEDFFSNLDSVDAQKAQFRILLENYVDTNLTSKHSNSVLFQNLRKGVQTEPLILTNDHKVLSGNRRYCIIKELNRLAAEKDRDKPFKTIDVIILPGGVPADEDALEYYLEQEQDGKIDFEWTAVAIDIRERLNRGVSYKDIATLFKDTNKSTKNSINELKELVGKLTLGEEYLKSRNKSLDYKAIWRKEFAFKGIYNGLTAEIQSNKQRREIAIEYCFELVDKPAKGARGSYGAINSYFSKIEAREWNEVKGSEKVKNPISNDIEEKEVVKKRLDPEQRELLHKKYLEDDKRNNLIESFSKKSSAALKNVIEFLKASSDLSDKDLKSVLKENKDSLKSIKKTVDKLLSKSGGN